MLQNGSVPFGMPKRWSFVVIRIAYIDMTADGEWLVVQQHCLIFVKQNAFFLGHDVGVEDASITDLVTERYVGTGTSEEHILVFFQKSIHDGGHAEVIDHGRGMLKNIIQKHAKICGFILDDVQIIP